MERKFWDEKIETMPIEELKKLQLKRLKYIVKYVYENNRHYHEKLKKANVKPDDIKTLKDIEKIPFLTKQDLRDYYPFGLVCTQLDEIVEVHASSGTTGKPVVGPYTRNDLEVWAEVMARSLWANGLRTALACTPSYSLYIAEVAKENGLDPLEDFSLRIGLFGAEAWSEEMRETIEKTWGIVAHEHYGLTEIIGPGVVSECSEKKLHINADHFLPEIIDPKTGEQLEPGEEGELVFTTLTKEAFPAIRFRTRDIASYYEEPCECGRTLPIQSRIKGRSDDMMKVKGVIVFPSQIEAALMKVEGVSGYYQLVKEKKGPMVTLSVEIEPTEERYKEGNLDELEKKIKGEIYSILNLHIPVKILPPRSIPRSTGKAKRVIER